MFKAFVYRLYPSKSQRKRLEAVRETCRHFYNDLLRERKDSYDLYGVSITKTEQLRKVKVEKDTSPYALDIHSHILQNVVADLHKAFEAFFRRVKAGENPGYPRFKSRNRFAGFGYKEYGNGFKLDGRRLKLSGIGRIAVRWHRELEGQIKTARRLLPGWQVVCRLLLCGRETRAAASDRGIDWHRPRSHAAGHVQHWGEERESQVVPQGSRRSPCSATEDLAVRHGQSQPPPADRQAATHAG